MEDNNINQEGPDDDLASFFDNCDTQRLEGIRRSTEFFNLLQDNFKAEAVRLKAKYGADHPMVTDTATRVKEIEEMLKAMKT